MEKRKMKLLWLEFGLGWVALVTCFSHVKQGDWRLAMQVYRDLRLWVRMFKLFIDLIAKEGSASESSSMNSFHVYPNVACFMLTRCVFGGPYYSCFLFGVLSALGIWSDCTDKALAICLQQLLYEPRPKVHPVVPEAAAPNWGGEVGGALHPVLHLTICSTTV